MIRALTIVAAVAAFAVSAAPAMAARDNNPFTLDIAKKPPSPRVVDAAFEDGDELFETVFVRRAQPKLRGITVTKVNDSASTSLRRSKS